MAQRGSFRSKKLITGLTASALLLLAAAAWLERGWLSVWYSVHRLVSAKDSDRQTWVDRVAELDLVALPKLIRCLRRAEAQSCAAAQAGLMRMVQRWEPIDSRRARLAGCLAEQFETLSTAGRRTALAIQAELLKSSQAGALTSRLLPAATRMLAEAARTADTEIHARALNLARSLTVENGLDRLVPLKAPGKTPSQEPDLIRACRDLVRTCLGDEASANRVRAIRLASQPKIGLLEAVVPLLTDPVAEVRRAAILAVGSAPTAMNTDDLLRWLHDPDPQVRSLCEKALRCRGLGDEHVKLGRLISDSRPRVRLQVLDQLRQANDLEPGIWLRHLSHDPAPAVRAAAVRAASEQTISTLADRLEQMAQNDPCPSIRQLAQYYLTFRKTGYGGLHER